MALHALLEAAHEARIEEVKIEGLWNHQFVVVQLDDQNSLQAGLTLVTAELLGGDSEDVGEFCLWVSAFQKSNRNGLSDGKRKNGNEGVEPAEGVEKREDSFSAEREGVGLLRHEENAMLLQCGGDHLCDVPRREGSKETVEAELVHVGETVGGRNAQCENLLEDGDLVLRQINGGTERHRLCSREGQKSTKWLMCLSTRSEESAKTARGRLGTRSSDIISQIEPTVKRRRKDHPFSGALQMNPPSEWRRFRLQTSLPRRQWSCDTLRGETH